MTNKNLLALLLLIIGQFVFSQHLEFGPLIGKRSSNMEDSRITDGKAVIGKSLWSTDKGFSVVYYFTDRYKNGSSAIQVGYMSSARGTRSEVFPGTNISFSAKSMIINYRYSNNLEGNFSSYFDAGFSYNRLDTQDIYHGTKDELRAFPKLKAPLRLKKDEGAFVAALGADKKFLNNKIVVFAQVGVEASIFKVNQDSGVFRNTSLTMTTGLRYVVEVKKIERLKDRKRGR